MRSQYRKILTCSLLATYAGISLLGQGLHLLTPHDGHHHGFEVVHCTTHGHAHEAHCCAGEEHSRDGHHGDHDQSAAGRFVVADGSISDSHACEICEFLFQAVSQPPQIAATPDLHILVADVSCPHKSLYSLTIVGLHSARGPPQLLA